jgi:type VI secretion system protein ImpL
MRALKSLWAVLTARWFVSLVGAALLALLVWFFGPLLSVAGREILAPERTRLLVILGITVLWGASNLWASQRARAGGVAMVEALAQPAQAPGETETAAVAARFKEAMARLKTHRFAKGRLYELPWYLMIGPPGSGKTTALLQSGLRFPLEQAQELRGVGGTRNCDWFFTDEAVLLDTAGRWTTQDSDRAADEGAWLGFLDLLKTRRPREPVNGVIVALPVDDLLSADGAQAGAVARAVRARLAELGARLGIGLPVYLLLTKADLIAGFREMFADLDERAREQVWGFTFPLEAAGRAPPRELVAGELDLLVDRLEARTLDRLEAERDPDRRAAVQAFPLQVAALAAPLQRFLEEAFAATGYETPPVLRGVYLTSGTQAGTPIDRLLAGLQRSFNLRLGPSRALEGNRSYFLTRLLRELIFPEAPLVRRASRLDRRERRRALAAWSAAAAAVLLVLGAWAWSYLAQVGSVGAYAGSLRTYAAQAAPVALPVVSPWEQDLRQVLPVLDTARALESPPPAAAPSLGLSQAGRLRAYGEEAYAHTLEGVLLPRLMGRVETRLRAELDAPEQAAESLKVYLALGGQGELPVPLVAGWFADDWRRAYPLDEQLRDGAAGHLDALLDRLPAAAARPAVDGELIRNALAAIDRMPLSKRAYLALVQKQGAEGDPIVPLQVAGPEATALFAAGPTSPLAEPIPALFTRQGFWVRFLPRVVPEIQAVVAEHDALRPGGPGLGEREQARLAREVLELYYADTIDRWQKVERALGFRLPASLADAGAVLRPLAVPPSPLARLLQTFVAETRLTAPPDAPADGGAAAQAMAEAQAAAGTVIRQLLARAGEPVAPLGEPVEARFRPLARAVAGEGGAPARLDSALQAANELYLALPAPGAPPTPSQSGQVRAQADRLAETAGDLPPPVGDPLEALAGRIEGAAEGQVLDRINDEYRAKVLPFCRQALADRFPFALGSGVDVSLPDLTRLFGAGGLFDQFAEQQLAPYVDMAQRPWRWLTPIGSSNGALAPFELARRLRDGLFAGGAVPRAGFALKPLDLDPGAGRVALDLDGQVVSYAHGPVQPVHMDWPAPSGSRLVRLTFVPVDGGTPAVRSKEGPWGWFRLLQEARLAPQGRPDLYAVTFAAGAHAASFELQADSVDNPFDLGLFQRFRCPGGL